MISWATKTSDMNLLKCLQQKPPHSLPRLRSVTEPSDFIISILLGSHGHPFLENGPHRFSLASPNEVAHPGFFLTRGRVEGKAARSTTWGSMLKKLFESTNSILMGSKIVWHIKGYFACKAFSDGGSTKGSNMFLGHVVWLWEGIAAFISREAKFIGWYSCWKQVSYFTVPDGTMDHYYLEPDGHPCINGWLSIGSWTKSLR